METLPKFRQMAAEAGRNADDLGITIFGTTDDAAMLKGYRDASDNPTVFNLPSASRDEILALLDQYVGMMI